MTNIDLHLSYTGLDDGLHYWLRVDGKAVSYVKVYSTEGAKANVSLCDIETREGFRNRGYASQLLQMVAQQHGVEKVSHDGGYTADGFNFIAKHVVDVTPVSRAQFSDMNFVHDWDTCTQEYL